MERQNVLRRTPLTVEPEGMAIVGSRVSSAQYHLQLLREAVRGESAALIQALVPMEDSRESLHIIWLSAASRPAFLPRTSPQSVTREGADDFDTLLEWPLALNIAGDPRKGRRGTSYAGGSQSGPSYSKEPALPRKRDAIRQDRRPIREGGRGLVNAVDTSGVALRLPGSCVGDDYSRVIPNRSRSSSALNTFWNGQ